MLIWGQEVLSCASSLSTESACPTSADQDVQLSHTLDVSQEHPQVSSALAM